MILHDQHIHSHYSEDSKEDLNNYLGVAEKSKVDYFITCEHVDFDPPSFPHSWIADFESLKEEIETLKPLYPSITFLYGIELGYRADHIQEMNDILRNNSFDLVQLSCHDDGIHDYYLESSFRDTYNDLCGYFDQVYKTITGYSDYDVLSHFDYGFKTAKIYHDDIDIRTFEDKIIKIFKKLIELDKALEINIKVQDRINDEKYLRYILNLYHSLGGKKLTLSSDAHEVKFYRYNFDKYINIIKESGFKYLCYYIKRNERHFIL